MELTFDLQAIQFMAVMSRLGGLLIGLPFFSNSLVPMRVKAGCLLALSVMVLPVLPPAWAAGGFSGVLDLPSLLLLLGSDLLLGLTVSIGTMLIFEAVNIGATILANEMGYNAAGQFDPSTEQPQTEIAVLLNLCFLNVFLSCNGHLDFIAVAVDSFSSLPPGAFALHPDHHEAVQQLGQLAFDFGLRLALPVLATMLLINLALGLISRFAEDFQVLMISFPIRIAAGLAVLSAAVPLILAAFRELAGQLKELLPRLVGY
ncbi:MAG: flagellar biosynthesis protein FliR [Verrucomicrobiota bacterium]|jgi:flagellar biosynthetic protein FliR